VLGGLPADRRALVIDDVKTALGRNRRGETLVLPATVRVVAAIR